MVATQEQLGHFALLEGHQYMNLTTYRKNGTEVSRPVWFAMDGKTIYLYTLDESGKVKHIRRNGDVYVSPSDARGNPLSEARAAGTATLHEKGTPTAQRANARLNKKYGLLKWLISLTFAVRGGNPIWIEIVPRQD